MQLESSHNSNERVFAQDNKIKKDNMICKDGFCSLPNHNEARIQNRGDENFFDPI